MKNEVKTDKKPKKPKFQKIHNLIKNNASCKKCSKNFLDHHHFPRHFYLNLDGECVFQIKTATHFYQLCCPRSRCYFSRLISSPILEAGFQKSIHLKLCKLSIRFSQLRPDMLFECAAASFRQLQNVHGLPAKGWTIE